MKSSYSITLIASILVVYFGVITQTWFAVIILAFFGLSIAILVAEVLDENDKFHPILRVVISGVISLISGITVLVLIIYLGAYLGPRQLPGGSQAEISKALNELPPGTFIFSCPKEMTLGISEKCTAIVKNKKVVSGLEQSLKKGMGKNINEVELRYISPIMNVKLTGQKFALWKDFDISPQEDGGDQLISDHDSTSWEWDVVPQESGNKKLKFTVSLILKIPGYEELPLKRYEGNEIEISIKSNLVFSITNFMKVNWKYFLTLCFVVFALFLAIKNLKIIGTNIEIGSIGNIDLKNNKGVLNFLAWCRNIDNNSLKISETEKRIKKLPNSLKEIKGLLMELYYFIQYNPVLDENQKEDAFRLLRKLIEIYVCQKSDIYDCAYIETSKLKEIMKYGSSTEAGFNLIDKIFAILFDVP